MRTDKIAVLSKVMDVLSKGENIPFALRNSANHYGINIEQLKELLDDVDRKIEEYNLINSESSETGV